MSVVNFSLTLEARFDGHRATLVEFALDGDLSPDALASLQLPEVDPTAGVILSGRGPIWLYAAMTHHYHVSRWVATHDPRVGAVVVSTHHPMAPKVGTVLSFSPVPV
jgi:CRISPR-associated protein Csx3